MVAIVRITMARGSTSRSMDHGTAFVGLGSNLGDRLELLRSAVRALDEHPSCSVAKTSPVFETRPIGPSSKPYLNAALSLTTTLDARTLLALLHQIEDDHGRVRAERWGARTLDLDLLLFTEPRSRHAMQSNEPALRLPHPALLQRDFVLEPLLHVAPALRVGSVAARLHLRRLRAQDRTILRRLDDPLRPVDATGPHATFAQLQPSRAPGHPPASETATPSLGG